MVSHQLENFSHFNQGWSISPITKNCSCIHWVGILCCSQTSPPHCQRYPIFIKLPFSFHYTNWSERMLSNRCYCFKIKSCPQMFVSPLKKMRKVILWDFVDFCEWDFQKKLFTNFNILNLGTANGKFKKENRSTKQPTNQWQGSQTFKLVRYSDNCPISIVVSKIDPEKSIIDNQI